jgi:hypothetical protein
MKKWPWTQEEEEELIPLVGKYGAGKWAAIAKEMAQLLGGRKVHARATNSPDLEPTSDLIGSLDGE